VPGARPGLNLQDVGLTISATADLTDHVRGLGAGVLRTAGQLGGALGLGVIAAIITARVFDTSHYSQVAPYQSRSAAEVLADPCNDAWLADALTAGRVVGGKRCEQWSDG
jgi:hypothetical protein